MKISQVIIRNILGVRELEIQPGQVTEVTGRNGSGKTSIMGAIRAAFGASEYTPAQLIHAGAEQGEVVVILDNGTKVHRRINPDGTDVKVTDAEGNRFAKPQSVLDALYAVTQFNPLRLLATDKKSRDERVKTILECMPLQVSREKVLELAPQLASQVSHIDTGRHGLAVLDDIEKRLFERRTDVNRECKRLAGSVQQLKDSMPVDDLDGADPSERLATLRNAAQQLADKKQEYLDAFERDRTEKREAAHAVYTAAVESARIARDQAIAEADAAYEQRRAEKLAAYEERMTPLRAEVARLEESAKASATVAAQRETIEKFSNDARALATQSDELTASIERIRAYRTSSTSSFPVPGLEIRDGEVFYEGLSFDQLNTAKRIELAVSLAVLRSGELGVICVDGCEALDSTTFAALEEYCTGRGLQMICTSVADTPLDIKVREVA